VIPYPILAYASWPKEIENPQELGLVADLQCGGWSTCILNDEGDIFVAGELNGEVRSLGHANVHFRRLKFPAGFNTDGLHHYTAIRQFSAGRSHVLGLSDSGRIWRWLGELLAGFCIKFNNLEYSEEVTDQQQHGNTEALGRVRSVVAGWNKSSAYIIGTGIVTWDVPPFQQQENQYMEDETIVLQEWVAVPRTSYIRPKGSQRDPDEAARVMGKEVGEVTNWVVLEHVIVFITDIGKVFAAPFHWDQGTGIIHDSIELTELQSLSETDPTPSVTDIQGSFRTFAVFKKNGEVLIANQDYLHVAFENATAMQPRDLPELKKIPALQNSGVIQVAFGDYHYHALHSSGRITSYGTEPQCCGALGLGGWIQEGLQRRPAESSPEMMEAALRGIRNEPMGPDRYVLAAIIFLVLESSMSFANLNAFQDRDTFIQSDGYRKLLPHAYINGREVWFQPEKKSWIEHLARGGNDVEEAKERLDAVASRPEVCGEVSEWVEQQGRSWDKAGDDGLGAYFALNVAAAGWHSGALVLVNDELAHDVAKSAEMDPVFPRLTLEDGEEMPGNVPVMKWLQEPPKLNLEYEQGSSSEVFGARGWRRRET
jgi:SCF-associated factor 1